MSSRHSGWKKRLEIESELAADHLAREVKKLVVALYEMQLGHRSPTEWHRHARENSPVRWLAMGIRPSRSRWYDFGDRLTRHKLLNQQTLERRTAELQQAIEDEMYGRTLSIVTPGKPVVTGPAWMAKTSSGREDQHRRYQTAGVIMQRNHRENAERPAHQRRPAEKIKISIGDPEAPLSLDKEKVFRPLYNVQLEYDLESPLILAYDVFAQPNDNGTLEPMLRRHERLTGCKIEKIFADSTYTSAIDLAACESAGVEMYGPYQENSLSAKKRNEHEDLVERLRQRMQTIEGMLLYKLRGQTVELGYADFKQHRKLRRFTRRGLQRASTEIGLLVLAHNGLTIVRAVQPQNKPPPNRKTPEKIAA